MGTKGPYMGLLVDGDVNCDVNAVASVARRVVYNWNTHGGPSHGFSITWGREQIQQCCERAATIFQGKCFPSTPGPFKRVAALIVLGRLNPFIGFSPPLQVQVDDNRWLSRIMALFIPITLSRLKLNIANAAEPSRCVWLDKFSGFPSAHTKLDFINWLTWLDSMNWSKNGADAVRMEFTEFPDQRLARMILATSLILEGYYYCMEGLPQRPLPDLIRGKCRGFLKALDLTSLTYDSLLFQPASPAPPPAAPAA